MKSRTNWKQWMRWWRRPSAAIRAQDFGDFGTAFGLELSLEASGSTGEFLMHTIGQADAPQPQRQTPRR